MKNIAIILLFILSLACSYCSNYSAYENVPGQVITNFELKFPDVENVAWSMTSKGDWEARFSVYHHGYSAFFDARGNWLETDHKIITSAVPLNIKLALHDHYQNYEIEDVFIAEKQSGMFYEMEILSMGHELDVEANTDGMLTREQEIK